MSEAPKIIDIQEDNQTQSGAKKKWIIGCGGCLVILAILAVLLFMLGGVFIGNMQKTSDQSLKGIFGEHQPSGYTAFALPIGQGEFRSMIFMMNPQGIVILGADVTAPESDIRMLSGGDTAKIEQYIRQFGAKADQSTAASQVSMEGLALQNTRRLKLANGKGFVISDARVESERKGTVSPGVIGLLPQGKDRLIGLFVMDAKTTSGNAQADFDAEWRQLETELERVVTESDLDDRLP